MLRVIFLSISFISLAYCQTPFRSCSGDANPPTNVNVIGCTKLPCEIVTGTTLIMYMNFTAPQQLDTLEAKVIAKIGIDIPYPLPEPNACNVITNTHCPLEINEPAQYKLEMPILTVFPEISLSLVLYLEANGIENNMAACFIIDARVIKP